MLPSVVLRLIRELLLTGVCKMIFSIIWRDNSACPTSRRPYLFISCSLVIHSFRSWSVSSNMPMTDILISYALVYLFVGVPYFLTEGVKLHHHHFKVVGCSFQPNLSVPLVHLRFLHYLHFRFPIFWSVCPWWSPPPPESLGAFIRDNNSIMFLAIFKFKEWPFHLVYSFPSGSVCMCLQVDQSCWPQPMNP